MSTRLDGWRATERRDDNGAIDSEQRARLCRRVVDVSDRGARVLGRAYWLEIARASRGLVRCREAADGVELRLLGGGPPLLSFGPAEIELDDDRVGCRHPIRGGLLTRRGGGALSLSQTGREQPELRAAVTGFFPRPALYALVQRRVHVAMSRRYFARLIAEAQR